MSRSRVLALENFQQFTAINVLSDPGHQGGPVVIPNAIQVVLNWNSATGKQAHNVLYGSVGSSFTPTPTIADALLTGITSGAPWTALQACLSTTTSLSGITLRDVRGPNLPLVQSAGAPHAGTNVGIALPAEVAICATLRTALTGVANRGRMYLVGFSVDQVVAGNLIAAGAVAAVQAWLSTIFTTMSGQAMTWSIGHPARQAYTGSSGTQHPARLAGLVPITGLVVRDNHWDSQRRRGLK